MRIYDDVHGSYDIREPVLIRLLHSPTVLRLKSITQAGVPAGYNSLDVYSRYEHSVGVMLLLRRLGAPLTDQVAGLLHDISHLAFSHVAEWIFEENGSSNENLNETLTGRFIYDSEIAGILEASGIDPAKIVTLKNFPLLKAPAPDINADRADYSLREIHKWRDRQLAAKIASSLIVHKDRIVVDDPEICVLYAREFLTLQTEYWGGFDAVLRYHLFSGLLKRLVDQGKLSFADFLGEEGPILELLAQTKDPDIAAGLEILRHRDLSPYRSRSGKRIVKYFRYIDPQARSGGRLARASSLSPEFRNTLAKEKKRAARGVKI